MSWRTWWQLVGALTVAVTLGRVAGDLGSLLAWKLIVQRAAAWMIGW